MADAEPSIDQVGAVTELLTGKQPADREVTPPADTGTGDGSPTGDQTDSGPQSGDDQGTDDLTPTILAEKLGMTPQALFKAMKIPVDGGDPLTLEEFKAAGKQLRGVRDAQHDLAEKRIAFENETMTQRQTVQDMLAKIPPELLTDELVADVQLERQRYVEGERQALLAVRPDLQDSAKWSGVRQLLIDHLAPYGFREIEIDQIVDHRLAKYAIDNAEREIRIRELEKAADKGSQPLNAPTKSQQQPRGRRANSKKRRTAPKIQEGATRSDKVAAVAKLIGETDG